MNHKHTKNCYMTCIPKYALIPRKLVSQAKKIISQVSITSNRGRKGLHQERMLQGIHCVLKTDIQWKYVPR